MSGDADKAPETSVSMPQHQPSAEKKDGPVVKPPFIIKDFASI